MGSRNRACKSLPRGKPRAPFHIRARPCSASRASPGIPGSRWRRRDPAPPAVPDRCSRRRTNPREAEAKESGRSWRASEVVLKPDRCSEWIDGDELSRAKKAAEAVAGARIGPQVDTLLRADHVGAVFGKCEVGARPVREPLDAGNGPADRPAKLELWGGENGRIESERAIGRALAEIVSGH